MRFQVFVNGEEKCIAGFAPHGVVSVNVTWVSRDPSLYEQFASRFRSKKQFVQPYTHLHVGGSPGERKGYCSWYNSDEIQPGDEITIKVLELGPADPPEKLEAEYNTGTVATEDGEGDSGE